MIPRLAWAHFTGRGRQRRLPYWALLALLLPAPAGAQAELPPSPKPLQSAELLRRGAGMTMLRSYLELGRFYLEHDRPDRARQILTYGLLHAPGDPELLSAAARAEVRLDHLEDALAFAEEAQRLAPSPEHSWQVQEIRGLLASRPPAVATTATTATTTAEAPTPALTSVAPTPPATEGRIAAKVKVLHLAVALENAIRGYNVGKKKKEWMTKLDLDKLKAEHFLPEEFDLSSYEVSAVTSEGKVSIEGQGTVADLQKETADYEKLTAEASKYQAEGSLAEATLRLQEMVSRFPDEPEVRERLLYVLRAQQRWDEALALVEHALEKNPADAALRYDRAMLTLQAGRVEQAAALATELASQPKAGVHGVLARELARIATAGPSEELRQDLLSLSGSAPTTTTTGSGR